MEDYNNIINSILKKSTLYRTQIIATGTSGKVYHTVSKVNGDQFAVKVINLKPLNQKARSRAYNEANILRKISGQHTNLLKVYYIKEEEDFLFIVTEYIECDLLEYVDNQKGLVESEAKYIFTQIISVLTFLHKSHICHGDIKLENFLIKKQELKIVLIDFGSASFLKGSRFLDIISGTSQYVAPEVIMGGVYDGFKADVYSLGVVLYGLITYNLPFDDQDTQNYYSWVENFHDSVKGDAPPRKFFPKAFLSHELEDLIMKMLTINPNERISLKGILKSSWYKKKNLDPFKGGSLRISRRNKSNRLSSWRKSVFGL